MRPELRSFAADEAIVPGPSTARTSGSFASVRWTRASALSREAVVTAPLRVTATISNGSVQPAPIDLVTVSYCARASLPDGRDLAVGAPVLRPSTGMQARSRTSAAASPSSGRCAAMRARLALTPPPPAVLAGVASPRYGAATTSIAGTTRIAVVAASSATTLTPSAVATRPVPGETAAATPIATTIAAAATATVRIVGVAARPTAAATSPSRWSASSSRVRETMSSE